MPRTTELLSIASGSAELGADLTLPEGPTGLVLFAHGPGTDRHEPSNREIAIRMQRAALGTLSVDLAGSAEDPDVTLLGHRVVDAARWAVENIGLPLGLLGSGLGAAAALEAAAHLGDDVQALVSLSGRVDLAAGMMPLVQAPTRLIVSESEPTLLSLNEIALQALRTKADLQILLDTPGALTQAADLAIGWFGQHLK